MDSNLLNINPGDKALVSVDNWFYAPDGKLYRAVFGTIKAAQTAEDTLGVRPNGKSTNWYLEIGNMTIAGCQIHYVVRCPECHLGPAEQWDITNGALYKIERPGAIYNADVPDA